VTIRSSWSTRSEGHFVLWRTDDVNSGGNWLQEVDEKLVGVRQKGKGTRETFSLLPFAFSLTGD
jgi:hypothetical protein